MITLVKYVPFSVPKAQCSRLPARRPALLPAPCPLLTESHACSSGDLVLRHPAVPHFRGMPRQQHISKSVSNRRKAPHAPRFPREIAVGRETNWLQTGQEAVNTGRNWHERRQKCERCNFQDAMFNSHPSSLNSHPFRLGPTCAPTLPERVEVRDSIDDAQPVGV